MYKRQVLGEFLSPGKARRFAAAHAGRLVRPQNKAAFMVVDTTLYPHETGAQLALARLKDRYSHPLWILQTQP